MNCPGRATYISIGREPNVTKRCGEALKGCNDRVCSAYLMTLPQRVYLFVAMII